MQNRFIKLLVFITCLLAITACSSLHSGSGAKGEQGVSAQQAADQVAESKGVGSSDTFSGENTVNGADNSTKLLAPHDQIYYFDFDDSSIHSSDQASLGAQSNYLAAHPDKKVRLEGDTDERGSREYNVALGWRRARAVAQMLEQEGVSKNQLSLVSYGQENPVALGHDESAWRLNRRVELKYTN